MKRNKTREMVLYALFAALVFLLAFTPIGYIYLPTASITIVHIPVIIGAFFLGVKGGAFLGFCFGLTSLIKCFYTPDAISALVLGKTTGFGLYNILLILLVIFLPRILVGVFSALVYKGISRLDKSSVFAMGVSAFVGSATNTVLFLGGLYVLAQEQAAVAFGVARDALLTALFGIVSLNGLLEAAAAVLICTLVGKALLVFLNNRKKNNTEN